ncbi:MAG: RDD family protein [Alphaproteobacteria bacterium]
MTESGQSAGNTYSASDVFDPAIRPELFSEVLPRRLLAFAVDAIIVIVAMVPAFVAVAVLGWLTLGLGWFLFPFVFGIVGLGYLALTLGGPESATIGMRMAGLEMRTLGGDKMYPLLAALHGLIFWVSVGLLTPLILVVGLMSNRARLLHDMLLGVVLLNEGPLREFERDQGS